MASRVEDILIRSIKGLCTTDFLEYETRKPRPMFSVILMHLVLHEGPPDLLDSGR